MAWPLTDQPALAPGMRIDEIDTPTVLIDLDKMDRNLRDWQSWMDARNVKLRVHVKTHKVPEIGVLQIKLGARGIACAKVSEAEPFADAGITDICLAYPVLGEPKFRRIADLARRGVRMTVNCEHELAVRQASDAASEGGVVIHLQIDVDSGMHRGGIRQDDAARLEALARFIEAQPGVDFDGLTTHRSYFFEGRRSLQEEGHAEGQIMVDLAERLRARGIVVREVNAGGSFTGKYVAEVPGITEVRAGTYIFYDLMHLYENSATEDRLALSALCTVVSRWGQDRLTVDGGTKTFSGDRGVVASGNAGPSRAVSKAAGRKVVLDRLTEEHGMGRAEEPVEVGEKIRFFPYHACTCCNLSNELVGIRADRVDTVWRVAARGRRV
jgi:D-serine deaminase-like pyridoxal phosphate-dependent protein